MKRESLSKEDLMEECGVVCPVEDRPYWEKKGAAVEISVSLPRAQTRQGKEWTHDLGCFFVKPLKRQNIEVREKHLDEGQRGQELRGF